MTCPFPDKQSHSTFQGALKARDHLEAHEGIDLGLRPYRCDDHWHLGHKHKYPRWLKRKPTTRSTR